MKDMIHMMTMMRMMDVMTKMTSECPIICSSNHIDTAPGLSHLKAKCTYVGRKPFGNFQRFEF